MAKSSGGGLVPSGSGLRIGGRIGVGRIKAGDTVLRFGDSVSRRGGFLVTKVNSATFGVSTSSGSVGRISKKDLRGGFVIRGNTFVRIR